MLITMVQIPASYLIPSPRYLAYCIASSPGLLCHQFDRLQHFCILKKTGGVQGLGMRLRMHAPGTPFTTTQHVAASVHAGNKTRSCVSLVCCLCQFNSVHLSIFGRNGTSVDLQNRCAVSANFGLIGMSKCASYGTPECQLRILSSPSGT